MLEPAARGAFVDTRVHQIGSRRFRALYQVFDTGADNPTGRCGAGREVQLFVYELTPSKPVERVRLLVSSCQQTLSLASQQSGLSGSESDFCSVMRDDDGFTVAWWEAGPEGKATSRYVLRKGRFVPDTPRQANR
ncbi:MAG: hypothetical protein GAK31_00589 [Stenotrophomonas maltophilia]|uniref:Uncharacterized protein n=1 Tax=Stenotrophomonas maltophilia TaxID=40324 RepID=A0A7V8FJN5_STEMA|nr:MAG: hypothetical protein GAK31_00589 [Stenotrophomonas maltophilia]